MAEKVYRNAGQVRGAAEQVSLDLFYSRRRMAGRQLHMATHEPAVSFLTGNPSSS